MVFGKKCNDIGILLGILVVAHAKTILNSTLLTCKKMDCITEKHAHIIDQPQTINHIVVKPTDQTYDDGLQQLHSADYN